MDSFYNLPFFNDEHRELGARVSAFAAQEIKSHDREESDIDGHARDYVSALARAGLLRYSVTSHDAPSMFDRFVLSASCSATPPRLLTWRL